MKKALLMAPMTSVHYKFNRANIQALKELGYEIHLLANFNNGEGAQKNNSEHAEEFKREGITVHSLPYKRRSVLGNLSLVKETRKILKAEKFDLIHTHTETGGLIMRLAKGASRNSTFVYTPHGMSFYKGSSLKSQLVYRPVERWIASGMQFNLAMNEEELQVFQKWNEKKARFVHGVGLNREKILSSANEELKDLELKSENNPFVILSVGELDENKNHAVVIRALSKLKGENFLYVICGIGPLKEELESLATELGIGKKVLLAGYRKDIPTVLNHSDLFVFPSHHEGLPVSVMEAMTVGLPVVCSRIRGNVDLIEDGVNGYLCSADDETAFLTAIKTLMKDAEKRKAFGETSRIKSENYGFENVVEELRKIYSEC